MYTLSVFFSSKCSLFHNSNVFGSRIFHFLYTVCAKIKKNNSGAKRLTITHFWKLGINFTYLHILLTSKLIAVILGTSCTRQFSSSNSPVTAPDYQLLRRWTVGWNASPQVSGAHKWQFTPGHSHTPLKGGVNRYRHDSQLGKGNDTNGRNWHRRRNCHPSLNMTILRDVTPCSFIGNFRLPYGLKNQVPLQHDPQPSQDD